MSKLQRETWDGEKLQTMPSRTAPQMPVEAQGNNNALVNTATTVPASDSPSQQHQQKPYDHDHKHHPHQRPQHKPKHKQNPGQVLHHQYKQHLHHQHGPDHDHNHNHGQPNLILILQRSNTQKHVLDCREAASAAKMKAMKTMSVNRVLGSIRRKRKQTTPLLPQAAGRNPNAPANTTANANANISTSRGDPLPDPSPEVVLDTPEASATRNVRLFCESGGPNGSGDEVLYLPSIVEACESSPSAAREACYEIRKFLSKDNYTRPYVQYNGVMLIRILANNPGKTFTRNMDITFVQTIKELLRLGRDPSVKQILMETLDMFGREKAGDEGLLLLNDMWRKEQEKMAKAQQSAAAPRTLNAPVFPPPQQQPPPPQPQPQPQIRPQPQQQQDQQNYFSRNHSSRHLPAPYELSSRIEEARTSANLLSQVVQSTPLSELIANELVREFADRCQSASRSVQAYMIAENPPPDNNTMETLIETNEQLTKAMNQHQRAILNARKAAGLGNGNQGLSPTSFAPPPGPPPGRVNTAPESSPPAQPPRPAYNGAAPELPLPIPPQANGSFLDANHFSDPERHLPFPKDQPSAATGQFNDQLGVEPYHPGFQETASYVGRQNSAVGKVTMYAAVPEVDSEDEDVKKGPKQDSIYRY
ncbi:GAT domain-containing protein [Diplocarpon mali]|nr:GAT domain-containing protein [Diplocarpon mali]